MLTFTDFGVDFMIRESVQKKRIIIVGKQGSGKTLLFNTFVDLSKNVLYTTRKQKKGEKHGIDYYFVDEYTFKIMKNCNAFKFHEIFDNCQYALANSHWLHSQLFILTPAAINSLGDTEKRESFIIYLDMPKDIRKQRLEKRMGEKKVITILESDKHSFLHFNTYNYRVTDPFFDANVISDTAIIQLEKKTSSYE